MTEQWSVSPSLPKSALLAAFGPDLEFDRELAPYTSFGTGGPARYLISANTSEDAVRAVRTARELGLPFFVMGGGSNLLVADSGYDGLVIRVNVKGLSMLGDTEIESGAGEELTALVTFSADNSLRGLEFAAGIWGTVGGAVYGNAGAYGEEMKDVVTEITLVDREGKVKVVAPDYCRFGYRDSYLKATGELIVNARFRLEKGDREKIRTRIDEILAMRAARHPVGGKSAGCIFKNVVDPREEHGKLPAGRLLEQVGAKSMSVGGAAVFEKHANIVVNTGNATSKDIRELADRLKEKVLDEFGIMLEEEIVRIGEF